MKIKRFQKLSIEPELWRRIQ